MTELQPAMPLVDAPLVDAPIVGVTVFAEQARVTRRGRTRLAAGEQQLVVDRLPLSLHADSVRVSGSGAASILGVDLVLRHQARPADEVIARLEEQLREARAALNALDDTDAIAAQRLEFLAGLGQRVTRTYAAALAAGQTDPGQIAALCDDLDAQQSAVREHRRDLVRQREAAKDRAQAAERELAARRGHGEPDHYAAVVALAVAEESEIAFDLSYVVAGAGWQSAYDVRLDGDDLTLSWFGLVTQASGEDWPECELRLSTARPSAASEVPELDPWFLDRLRPPTPMMLPAASAAARSGGYGAPAPPAAFAPMLEEAVAVVEQGATAATYRPERAVAVPADGRSHRSTVAILHFDATRDYITAPVRAEEAHVRATVVNSSAHTFPGGRAAVFHGGDFVGSTALKVWAPGEEIELALGVDDRVRVERELVRRSAAKAVLGSTRRREADYRISVTNHTPGPARITVLDQLPVSRDDAIVVKETRLDPAPTERTDLGVLTWALDLAAGEKQQINVGVRVELSRGVELAGWRE